MGIGNWFVDFLLGRDLSEKKIKKISRVPFRILLIFNVLVGVLGGTWLLRLGQWPVVLGGVLLSLSMPWWWVIVSFPSKCLLTVSVFYENKADKVGTILFRVFAGLYDTSMLIGWVLFVLIFASSISYSSPMSLFAYAVAMTPLLYMASRGTYYNSNASLVLTVLVLTVVMCIFNIVVSPFIILFSLILLRSIIVSDG